MNQSYIFTLSLLTPDSVLQKIQQLFYVVDPSEELVKTLEWQQYSDFRNVLNMKTKFVFQQLYPHICKWNSFRFFTQMGFHIKTQPIYYKYHILKSIQHIDFSSLSQLYLCAANIHSIEGLSLMDLQNVTWLDLRKNKITSLKPFAKINLPSTQTIDLAENKFDYDDGFEYIIKVGLRNKDNQESAKQNNLRENHRLQIFSYCNIPLKLPKIQIFRKTNLRFDPKYMNRRYRQIYRAKMAQKMKNQFRMQNESII